MYEGVVIEQEMGVVKGLYTPRSFGEEGMQLP